MTSGIVLRSCTRVRPQGDRGALDDVGGAGIEPRRLATVVDRGLLSPLQCRHRVDRVVLALERRALEDVRRVLEPRGLTTVERRVQLGVSNSELPGVRDGLEPRPFPTVERRKLLARSTARTGSTASCSPWKPESACATGARAANAPATTASPARRRMMWVEPNISIPPGLDRPWCGRLSHLTATRLEDGKAAVKRG